MQAVYIRDNNVSSIYTLRYFTNVHNLNYQSTETVDNLQSIRTFLIQFIQNNRAHLQQFHCPARLLDCSSIYLALSMCPNLQFMPCVTVPNMVDDTDIGIEQLDIDDTFTTSEWKQCLVNKRDMEHYIPLLLQRCKRIQNLEMIYALSCQLGERIFMDSSCHPHNVTKLKINWRQIPSRHDVTPVLQRLQTLTIMIGDSVDLDEVHAQTLYLRQHVTGGELTTLSLVQHESSEDVNRIVTKDIEARLYTSSTLQNFTLRLNCPVIPIIEMSNLKSLRIDQVHIHFLPQVFEGCPALQRLFVGRLEGKHNSCIVAAAATCKHIRFVRIDRCDPSAVHMLCQWSSTLRWLKIGIIDTTSNQQVHHWISFIIQVLRELKFLSVRLIALKANEIAKDYLWNNFLRTLGEVQGRDTVIDDFFYHFRNPNITTDGDSKRDISCAAIEGMVVEHKNLRTLHCQSIPEDQLERLRFPNIRKLALMGMTLSRNTLINMVGINNSKLHTLLINNTVIQSFVRKCTSRDVAARHNDNDIIDSSSSTTPLSTVRVLRLGKVCRSTLTMMMAECTGLYELCLRPLKWTEHYFIWPDNVVKMNATAQEKIDTLFGLAPTSLKHLNMSSTIFVNSGSDSREMFVHLLTRLNKLKHIVIYYTGVNKPNFSGSITSLLKKNKLRPKLISYVKV